MDFHACEQNLLTYNFAWFWSVMLLIILSHALQQQFALFGPLVNPVVVSSPMEGTRDLVVVLQAVECTYWRGLVCCTNGHNAGVHFFLWFVSSNFMMGLKYQQVILSLGPQTHKKGWVGLALGKVASQMLFWG